MKEMARGEKQGISTETRGREIQGWSRLARSKNEYRGKAGNEDYGRGWGR